MKAIQYGRIQSTRLLLAKGADVNAKNNVRILNLTDSVREDGVGLCGDLWEEENHRACECGDFGE